MRAASARVRSVHWWVGVASVCFGLTMLLAIAVQSFSSQYLIEHSYWEALLREVSADHRARVVAGEALPQDGLLRSWYLQGPASAVQPPALLAELAPGYYSTESAPWSGISAPMRAGSDGLHALIVDMPAGRLITAIDIGPLELQQNRAARASLLWVAVVVLMIAVVMIWLHFNLVLPVQDLATRMRAIPPDAAAARLPTHYRREEMQIIAQAGNAYLQRVEQFIERERSVLDQTSHEFRTPIAVIAGALDLLKLTPMSATTQPALRRIEQAVHELSETMTALLVLAREPAELGDRAELTLLHELVPRLVADHQHLLQHRCIQLRMAELEPTLIVAPEAMLRIAVGNVLRNAIENTDSGSVEIELGGGVLLVSDTGSGFDPQEAARRYRDSLRHAAPVRGRGLGLYLVGRICDRYGWTFSVEHAAGGGTRARLDLAATRE